MPRSVVSETELRIANLDEIKRRSSETHELILCRLEEYHSYAFYHKSFLAAIRHFPSELPEGASMFGSEKNGKITDWTAIMVT